jgi:hypothetical protein
MKYSKRRCLKGEKLIIVTVNIPEIHEDTNKPAQKITIQFVPGILDRPENIHSV